MKRKNCKESKDSNPNWLEKVILTELDRVEYNFTECFLDGNDKILKFNDNGLYSNKVLVGYSSEIK